MDNLDLPEKMCDMMHFGSNILEMLDPDTCSFVCTELWAKPDRLTRHQQSLIQELFFNGEIL